MPPKAKYSKDEIIEQAIQIVKEQGIESLTARELAKVLNTSAKPIFTAFTNMEDLKQCVFDYAFQLYHNKFNEPFDSEELFRNIGLVYINFAIEEPKLFEFVFMKSQNTKISFKEFMHKLDDDYEGTIGVLMNSYELNKNKAEELYSHMWIYCHGIATMCATNQCKFTQDEIISLIDTAFCGIFNQIKNGK